MSGVNDTHITLELFNGCSGTCHGCMLSSFERSVSELKYNLKDFEFIIDKLIDYSKKTGLKYRPELSFGDFVSLPIDIQKSYYDICHNKGLQFGITATFAESGLSDHYKESLRCIESIDSDSIVNLTIDPFRAISNKEYLNNVVHAIHNTELKFHLQILLSGSVIEKFSPKDLSEFCLLKLNTGNVLLGFTPTIDNLNFRVYNYNVETAIDYAKEFYSNLKASGFDILKEESKRFENAIGEDEYSNFLKSSFFIGEGSFVYPMCTTIYGDLFFDKRNKMNPLGSLLKNNLVDILSNKNKNLLKISMLNDVKMLSGNFNCHCCDYLSSCKFNGVGIARKHYSDFENKANGCYGPVSLYNKEDDAHMSSRDSGT